MKVICVAGIVVGILGAISSAFLEHWSAVSWAVTSVLWAGIALSYQD
jgi:hypothetical protein